MGISLGPYLLSLVSIILFVYAENSRLTASSHSINASLERGRHIVVVSLRSDSTSGNSPLSQSPYNMILRKPAWFFDKYARVAVLFPLLTSQGLHLRAKMLP